MQLVMNKMRVNKKIKKNELFTFVLFCYLLSEIAEKIPIHMSWNIQKCWTHTLASRFMSKDWQWKHLFAFKANIYERNQKSHEL